MKLRKGSPCTISALAGKTECLGGACTWFVLEGEIHCLIPLQTSTMIELIDKVNETYNAVDKMGKGLDEILKLLNESGNAFGEVRG